jgi:pantoate--beta-alanine ligase
MRVFKTITEFQNWRRDLDGRFIAEERRFPHVGFVPTMGALHDGHRSLLERAAVENDVVVLSIFVNPTQFNRTDDLAKYPKTIEADLALADQAGVSAVFLPEDPQELYRDGYRYQVSESEFSKRLCGASRPGHFEGVLTVVLKLLHLAKAERAYFGEKDYQQLSLIRGMARAFFLDTEIVACPTVREADGLAMSSRNLRLTPEQREAAPEIFRAMTRVSDVEEARKRLAECGFHVDYFVDEAMPDGKRRRFAAASLGEVRLIDNVALDSLEGGPV